MKKITFSIGFILIIAITINVIVNSVEQNHYKNKYDNAYACLFVTERNEVFNLYRATEDTIQNPVIEQYNYTLQVAKKAKSTCDQVYGQLSDDIIPYGSGLVYYATFYRDIINAIERNCDINDLQYIYNILGKILLAYDNHSNPVKTEEKIQAIKDFYYDISLLNDEMRLCENLRCLTENTEK